MASSDQRPPLAPPFIASALRPQIAIYASPDVDELARANGLENLAQLLKPWEGSVERVNLRTSGFVQHTVPVLPLLLDDSRDLVHTDLDALFLDNLTTSVEKRVPQWLDGMQELDVGEGGDHDLWQEGTIEELTPWYAFYRDLLLNKRPRTEYETFGHPVACIIAVSTSSPEPLNAFAALYDETSPERLFRDKPWVDPGVLRYYVLVHDLSTGSAEEWQPLLEDVRRAYGVHCGFLALNAEAAQKDIPDSAYTDRSQRPKPKADDFSEHWREILDSPKRPSRSAFSSHANLQQLGQQTAEQGKDSPDEPGRNLGEEDVRRIKAFLREFTVQSLVPWMERSVSQTNEQLAANRKGIAARLFSVGRRYFGSRPASPGPGGAGGPAYDPIKGIYPYQTQEAQTRRLADFAFMISDFRLASAMYEICRKDFMNDKAWRYYASASRMAGLTGLLLSTLPGTATIDADHYLDQAGSASPPGTTPLDELRAICMYYELYRTLGDWRRASLGLLRSAGDIEELPSAIMLEQAAMAVLHLEQPARRRFALLMTIASHRYQKTGSKALARRCGLQALSIYPRQATSVSGQTWAAARNHLEHALGRQAYNTGQSEQAIQHFVRLLAKHDIAAETPFTAENGATDDSGSGQSDESFLDDFKLAWDLLGERADEVARELDLALPGPVFDVQATTIVTTAQNVDAQDPAIRILEAQFLERGYPYSHSRGRVRKAPASLLPDSTVKSLIVDDTFHVTLVAKNSLGTSYTLRGIRLAFEADGDAAIVEADVLGDRTIPPRSVAQIPIKVRALQAGTCRLRSVRFRYNGLLQCTELLEKRGRRLFGNKAEMVTPTYSLDDSLTIKVRAAVPVLQVEQCSLPAQCLAGEVALATLSMRNAGTRPMGDLRVLCSHPAYISHLQSGTDLYAAGKQSDTLRLGNNIRHTTPHTVLPQGQVLAAGETTALHIAYRGDDTGMHEISWLFVYTEPDADLVQEYTSQYNHTLEVLPSLVIRPQIWTSMETSGPAICLDIDNPQLGEEVEIAQVSAVSAQWRIGQTLENRSIPSGQAVSLRLPLQHAPSAQDPAAVWKLALTQLDLLLAGRDLETGKPADIDVHISQGLASDNAFNLGEGVLHEQFLSTRANLRIQALQGQFPTMEPDLFPRIFPLFTPGTLDLLVFWRLKASGRMGHHYIADLPIGSLENVAEQLLEKAGETLGGRYEESQRDRAVIIDSIAQSETGVDHCPVLVTQTVPLHGEVSASVKSVFHLQNTSTHEVQCVLELLGPNGTGLEREYAPVQWIGKQVHRRTLTPGATADVLAIFRSSSAGCRDAGSWLLDITRPGKQWTVSGEQRLHLAG